MENIIQKHRAFVAGQIEKSFDSNLQSPAQEVEKAYNVGDEKDFNGRTYYVHGLNAKGQPLWRLKSKKTKSDNERKFKEDFKDASDDVLQKIVEGKIQAGDQEKKWATDIINERKKSGKSEAAAKKIIDLLTASSSKYTDIKKVVAFKTDKGNWAIDYDGANTGIILNGSKLSERELRTAGVKIEGANANKKTNDTDNEFVTSKEFSKNKNAVTEILNGCDSKDDNGSIKYHVRFYALGMDRGSAWMKKSDIESYLRQYSDAKITPIKSNKTTKTDPRDKIAQDAGFKDYAEMKGFQEYVTTKSLLKKPSMQAKTKQAEREALEKQVADYEKNHADVITARNGGGKKKTESYASMDIKDAKKALVGKVVTLSDYWPDGRGGSQDAIGEIKNVRLYGKNKTPIAEVTYPNGDEQMIRLDEIDDGKMKDSYKTPITIGDDKKKLDAIKNKIASTK